MTPRIRDARPEDRPAIAALHAASWQAAYARFLPADVLADLPRRFALKWQDHASGGGDRVLLIEEGGALLGFAAFLAGDPLWLDNLHVRPDLRGGGIGRRLLAGCAACLRGASPLPCELTVIRDNDPARRFYAAMGARVVAEERADVFGTDLAVLRLRWDDIVIWGEGPGT